jgi:hypothetical protein
MKKKQSNCFHSSFACSQPLRSRFSSPYGICAYHEGPEVHQCIGLQRAALEYSQIGMVVFVRIK